MSDKHCHSCGSPIDDIHLFCEECTWKSQDLNSQNYLIYQKLLDIEKSMKPNTDKIMTDIEDYPWEVIDGYDIFMPDVIHSILMKHLEGK